MRSALEVPKVSDVLKKQVLGEHLAGMTGLQSLLRGMTAPEKHDDLVKKFPEIAENIARQTAVNGEMVIAAAVVVLSHSTADDVFSAACDLAAELETAGWISELDLERTVTLKELKDKSTDEVFRFELERFRKRLPRKSLPSRAELLFRHVDIRHHPMIEPTDHRHFRLSDLKEADDLRISIVHGGPLTRLELGRTKNMMEFLHEAAITALRSVAYAFKIPLDMKVFIQSGQATKK